ncbi:Zinc finger, PHD-type domain and Zinc finger, FYVE/PHD-type domain and Zinc finger, RING/FYVE/PHD-type domain and Zinc finger, PHD-finger domain-containing protein [Strongyloides ratti]|uniref:Zinc finger, PHD-type domain and Zinc finger, FYVE/PHD-type domain and Zinc finger, RING/FYVE/PHD-type domain and Zinc finger, PHD-finger domain-containing protein n=1 Tax=Strongyloides ratti TaxID=34506 RepID=A0A090LCD6_STRRB|nr:Zinc finger, PHD-type domain and Zinc finger, FYVE/PHD-type domain and Zinc finger, RING/FYVE/PHD-type domain and Zinc finger, PHD-finger domain-containing protein [Strongyloides ratti]CEF65763.1 Zinc finger, PHD-type domain and Zinc finger, FYVE/PHD-type domain and Zinc finger, RING/FYVE/PHD-type domain and Zinc finger, PHD-finger domain-containing protein [Strongyloides ratti]
MVKTRALSAKQPTHKVGVKRKRTEILSIKSLKKVCDLRNGDEYSNETPRTLRNQSKYGRKLTIDCSSINPNSPSSRENITPSPIPKDSTKELESRNTQTRKNSNKLQNNKNTTIPGNNTIGTPSLYTLPSSTILSLKKPAHPLNITGVKDAAEVFDAHIVSEMRRQNLFTGSIDKTNKIKSIPMSDKWESRWDTGVQIPCGNKEYSYNAIPEIILPNDETSEIPEEFSKRICAYEKKYIDNNFVMRDNLQYLEYNLDRQDIMWFKDFNESHSIENLVISMMSECFNFMEKTFYIESRKKLIDPIIRPASSMCNGEEICEVCRDYDSDEDDKIVFCDKCDKGFHQHCYGILDVNDVFICNPCMLLDEQYPTCMVCPVQGGALKILDNGYDFCHVNCAKFIKELKFGDDEILEPILGYMNICDSRGMERCSVCDIDFGYTIKCDHPKCNIHFHAECGRRAGFYLNFLEREDDDDTPFVLCERHTMDLRNLLQNNKSTSSRNKKITSEFEKLIQKFIQLSGETRVSTFNLSFLEYINIPMLLKKFPDYNKEFIESLYEYWKLKKINNDGNCLLKNSNLQITYNIKTKDWKKTEVLYDIHREDNKSRLEKGYLGFLMKSYLAYNDYKSVVNAKANLCALIERIEITKRTLDEEKFGNLEKLKLHKSTSLVESSTLSVTTIMKKNQDTFIRGHRQSLRLDEKYKGGHPKYSPKANFDEIYERSNSSSRRRQH